MSKPRYWLIVPAAGSGQRMKADCPKQYLRLGHRYILDITLSRLLDHADFSGCMVAVRADDPWWTETAASSDARINTCVGGSERADSVLAALDALADRVADDDWVLVHDAARPCLDSADFNRLLTELRDHPVGGLLATPVADTLKRVASDSSRVEATIDRRHLWRALTPQMFRFATLKQALESAIAAGYPVTDEASAVERAGGVPCIVEGRPDNIKITVPADLALAGFILSRL